MKKWLIGLLGVIFAVAVMGLTACKDKNSNGGLHASSDINAEQSTGDGSSGSFSGGSEETPHQHEYTAVVTAPTCTERGYTEHTCACGDSYVDTYVSALNHDFKDYISDNNATCMQDGTKTATCSRSGCKETDTITDEGTKLAGSITFKTLSVNGTNVYGKVSNTVETFSFIGEVLVGGAAKFIVSLDVYGMQQVPTKTISLTTGDNTVYITEIVNDEPINIYTVTVRRRPMYEVTFNTNGGVAVEKQMVEEDSFASYPTTERAGYTFVAWDYDFATPITNATTINATWEIITYTITYDLNGGELEENKNPTSYTVETDTMLLTSIPRKANYGFLGWYNGDEKVESIEKGDVGSLNLVARWENPLIISDNIVIGVTASAKTTCYEIKVPDTVTEISSGAFNGCTVLEKLTLPSVYKSLSDIFGNKIPYSLKEITITSGVISNIAFYGCDNLTSVVIDNGVTSIGNSAFEYCSNLTSVVIGNGVTSIGERAFSNCESLTSIEIPDSVTSIGNFAFYGCDNLTSVKIGDGVTSIGDSAFEYCRSLTSVKIGDGVTSIGDSAFKYCYRLTSVKIPDSVTSIGTYAFFDCESLTNVVIPNSVTTIGYSAFSTRYGLTIYCEAESQPSGWNGAWTYSDIVYWYSETQPTTTGNYWHYDENGNIVVWEN